MLSLYGAVGAAAPWAILPKLAPVASRIPAVGLLGGLAGWLSGILMAVPKKKTTHRKKRLRMATKWLKPMRNITTCPFCGQATLQHHICRSCAKKALS
ncbi:hypothetical protein DFS34DRAFT_653951 [Phlyctochytrium arcticum]|nr:hypothetical protein DFS34DRAFT_653951 [Phlyctochytrium arcticum]